MKSNTMNPRSTDASCSSSLRSLSPAASGKEASAMTAAARIEIGMRIRRERLLWDLTQEELSAILGVSPNYLGQIERGNRDLSRNMEDRICNLFHLTHDDLRHGGQIHTWPNRVSEAGVIFNDLQEEEVQRLLHSCSPAELQLCGHVLRSMLLFLRNPQTAEASTASDGSAYEYLSSAPVSAFLSRE